MLYTFMDWRVLPRRLNLNVKRLQESLGGVFPHSIRNDFNACLRFAGAAGFEIPTMQRVAETIKRGNQAYPTLDWVEEHYQKMLEKFGLKEESCQPYQPCSKQLTSPLTSTGPDTLS